MKRALIFDLDNTIYPVSSIADHLFADLFSLLDESVDLISKEKVEAIKEEMTRRPFQHIADKFQLDTTLRDKMINTLRTMTYDLPMQPFDDYHHLKQIPLDKFLVTTGFVKLQYSKIERLGIGQDFKEIIIVDPESGNQTKQGVFADIMKKHGLLPEEILVIGDDPESEIRAARALDIDTFLFNPQNMHPHTASTYKANSLKDVLGLLG